MAKRTNRPSEDRASRLRQIKRLAVIAVFSDDELLEKLVLKGGNALDLVHNISSRASIDLDFSMEAAFTLDELPDVGRRLEYRLRQTFGQAGYEVFDVQLFEKPDNVSPDLASFWGGYQLEFKIIEAGRSREFNDVAELRRNAIMIDTRAKFEIDISKHEYCKEKEKADFDGYAVFVYPPRMILCEKLRAICQQMPEYLKIVRKSQSRPRARDFTRYT